MAFTYYGFDQIISVKRTPEQIKADITKTQQTLKALQDQKTKAQQAQADLMSKLKIVQSKIAQIKAKGR